MSRKCLGGVSSYLWMTETFLFNLFISILIYVNQVLLYPVESYGPYGQRSVIICAKDRLTPRNYPRDPGTPAMSPL
uniref:Uncharacterized protein n=1 Tax=Rhizophora mucronata TaxID=61149 RepID=A0A2P2PMJ8_RHIMU